MKFQVHIVNHSLLLPPLIIMIIFAVLGFIHKNFVVLGVFLYGIGMLNSFFLSFTYNTTVELFEEEIIIYRKNWFHTIEKIKIKLTDLKKFETGRYNGNYITLITNVTEYKIYEKSSGSNGFIRHLEELISRQNESRLKLDRTSNLKSSSTLIDNEKEVLKEEALKTDFQKIDNEVDAISPDTIKKRANPFENKTSRMVLKTIGVIGLFAGLFLLFSDGISSNAFILIGLSIGFLIQ